MPTTLFPLNAIFQENRGYLAIISFAVFVGIFFEVLLWERYKKVFIVCLMLLLMIYSVLVFNQNKVWVNEFSLWSHVVKNAPESYIGYTALGMYYQNTGELGKAEYLFHKAIDIGGDSYYNVHRNLGRLYILQDKQELAIPELEKAISIYPYSSGIHNDLGSLYYRRGRKEPAEKHYKEAIRLSTSDYMPYFNLGILYDEKGMVDEAINMYKTALSINPMHLKSHFLLGILLEDNGMNKDAMGHYQKVSQYGEKGADEGDKEIIVKSVNRLKKMRQ